MSDFTSQSTEGDRVYYSWVFRGLQVKDSPDVTKRNRFQTFRRQNISSKHRDSISQLRSGILRSKPTNYLNRMAPNADISFSFNWKSR